MRANSVRQGFRRRRYRLTSCLDDETLLDLFEDVAGLLEGLESELSCTIDPGNDPTSDIRKGIRDLRGKLATSAALLSTETARPVESQTHKKESA